MCGRYVSPDQPVPSGYRPALIAVAVLAGCTSPGSLVNSGERLERRSEKAPEAAAYCVAANAARVSLPLETARAEVRAGPRPGEFEVAHRTGFGDALSLTRITPEGGGSRIEVWFRYSSSVMIGSNFGARVLGDC